MKQALENTKQELNNQKQISQSKMESKDLYINLVEKKLKEKNNTQENILIKETHLLNQEKRYELCEISKNLFELNKFDECLEYSNKVLSIDPKNIFILDMKSFALFKLNKFEESIEYANKVLSFDLKNIHALDIKSLSLFNLDKFDESIECSDKVL